MPDEQVVLVDTSAWIEFLRKTGSRTNLEVRRLISKDAPIVTTDVVVYELLAGVPEGDERRVIWSMLSRCRLLPLRPLFDYEEAATLYARCREAGVTPRSMGDCLIAAVAIAAGARLLHKDRDFSAMAKVLPDLVA